MAEPPPTALTIAAVKHVRNNAATQYYLAMKRGDLETQARFDRVLEALMQAYPEITSEVDLFPEWPSPFR